MNDNSNNQAAAFARRFVLCAGVSCLAIGVASLSLAYLFGDRAWQRRFGQLGNPDGMAVGYWIELARLVLITGLTTFVLRDGFSEELQQLFQFGTLPETSGKRRWVVAFRCFFVVLAILLSAVKSSEVFDLSEDGAPAKLVQWGFDPQNGVYHRSEVVQVEQIWGEAQRGYLLYTAYAQVIYAVFIPLIATVSLYAVIAGDSRFLASADATAGEIAASANPVAGFRQFKNQCYRRAMRYLNLYAAISLVLLFLQWDPVLPDREHQWVRAMAYCLSAVAVIFVIYVWMVYHDLWYRVSCALADEDEAQKFSAANAPLEFFKSMFKQPLPGLAIAGLAAMLLRHLLPFVFPG